MNIRRNAGIVAITVLCFMNSICIHAMENDNIRLEDIKKAEEARATEAK